MELDSRGGNRDQRGDRGQSGLELAFEEVAVFKVMVFFVRGYRVSVLRGEWGGVQVSWGYFIIILEKLRGVDVGLWQVENCRFDFEFAVCDGC